MPEPGMVILVGAGPGDPGLLTLAGRAAIESADVILYDRLVGDGVVAALPEGAEKIDVGKNKGNHTLPQEEINRLLLEYAGAGRTVVRLKGGDPYLFGRGAEELAAVAAAGIPFRVIPGVTSAIAAPATAGIPVTHRDRASSLHILTGHGKNGRAPDIPYRELARLGGTLVFLMSLSALDDICGGLVAAGMAPDTPAALVENGARDNQRRLPGTLATLPAEARRHAAMSPALLVVGSVCELADELDWTLRLPLRGRRILAAGSRLVGGRLATLLRDRGAAVDEFAGVETEALRQSDDFWDALSRYDWIVLTSAFGVDCLFDGLAASERDIRALARARFAAIGERTKRALLARGVRADFTPAEFTGRALGAGLAGVAGRGERVLLFRAETGDAALPARLREGGLEVDDVAAYRTFPRKPGPALLAALAAGAHDAAAFTSSSAVEALADVLPEGCAMPTAFCIGPTTAAAAERRGMRAVVAREATVEGLAEAVVGATVALCSKRNWSPKLLKQGQNLMNIIQRPRRLRSSPRMRRLVRETRVSPDALILPFFVREGKGVREELASLPGQIRYSPDTLHEGVEKAMAAGVGSFLLFGVPETKDAEGSGAWAPDGVVQRALRSVRERLPEALLVTDVCLCEYTDHGHCGVVGGDGHVHNDETLELLARTALSHAEAGADMVAPSDMMDARVAAVRTRLDENGFAKIPVMSYAAKYSSNFYGPFREAAGSAPGFGDRKGYQMDWHNRREAAKETLLDLDEGADIIIVKPALSYLDILADTAALCDRPVAAYNVSGEYAMIKAAAAKGWLDGHGAMCETAAAFFRAGADILITYFAEELAEAMRKGDLG